MESNQLTFQQWIKHLSFDIYSILQAYKDVFFHRSKIACLCQELHNNHKDLSNGKYSNEPPSPNEMTIISYLNTLIGDLRSFFVTLSKS